MGSGGRGSIAGHLWVYCLVLDYCGSHGSHGSQGLRQPTTDKQFPSIEAEWSVQEFKKAYM